MPNNNVKNKTAKIVVPIQSFELLPTKNLTELIIPYCTSTEGQKVNQKYLKRPFFFPITIQEVLELSNDGDFNNDRLFYGIVDLNYFMVWLTHEREIEAHPVKHP